MKSIKVFSKAILLSGLVVFGSGTGHAETVSQSGGVTVIRGVDDAGTAEQRQESRGRLGIAVFRGASDPSGFAAAPAAPAMMAPQQVTGGRHLWIRDPANGTVTACGVRYDLYGNRYVQCDSTQ